jgi:DNA adenine methylase
MTYPGGKNGAGVYHAIINQMPKHRVYIEPFLGGGAILRHKKPAELSIGVEPNKTAFDAWREFESESFHFSKFSYGSGDRTLQFTPVQNHHASSTNVNLRIYNYTFNEWREGGNSFLDQPDTLIYLDPPYLMETRSNKSKRYDPEFSDWFSHEELLTFLLTLECNVMISGYDHPVYNERLAEWRKTSFTGFSRGGTRVETLWMNFEQPAELHDYRYLGKDYREREDIRRQQKRWIAKLEGMPPARRYALQAAIEEFNATQQVATLGRNSGAIVPSPVDPPASVPDGGEVAADASGGYKGRDHRQHPTRPELVDATSPAASAGGSSAW